MARRGEPPIRVLLMAGSMEAGGSERQTLMLLRHLDRARFRPVLYLSRRTGELLTEVPADVDTFAFSDVAGPAGWYFPGRRLRQQTRYLRSVIEGQAIDVVYDRTFHMTLMAGPAARRARVPRVATVVAPPDRMLPQAESRFVWLKRRRLSRAYRDAVAVTAASRQVASATERYYELTPGRVEVIPSGVDGEAIRAAMEPPPPARDDRPTLVCVGRMTEEKGHADLLEALRRLPPADLPGFDGASDSVASKSPGASGGAEMPAASLRVWLIGDGPLRAPLRQRWEASPGHHQVDWLGVWVPAWSAIAAADALVLPSRFEGTPNVVLEAMALGTPVIATRAGGTAELQRDRPIAFWAEPGNPKSLAEAIRRWLGNPAAAAAQAAEAKRLVLAEHDPRVFADRVGRLLLRAAGFSEPIRKGV